MKFNITVLKLKLSREQSAEVNEKGSWSNTIWGTSYLNLNHLGILPKAPHAFDEVDKHIVTSDLYLLADSGMYHTAARYQIERNPRYHEMNGEVPSEREYDWMADQVFDADNLGIKKDLIWSKPRMPSMSVGDIAIIERPGLPDPSEARYLVAAGFGWVALKEPQKQLLDQLTWSDRMESFSSRELQQSEQDHYQRWADVNLPLTTEPLQEA
jgi:hypothetical protein